MPATSDAPNTPNMLCDFEKQSTPSLYPGSSTSQSSLGYHAQRSLRALMQQYGSVGLTTNLIVGRFKSLGMEIGPVLDSIIDQPQAFKNALS